MYGTMFGRMLLKAIMTTHADRVMVRFLRSPLSKPLIPYYVKKHDIPVDSRDIGKYGSFGDFFARKSNDVILDCVPEHLISPCDGWLSVCSIDGDSVFRIKGSDYRICDFFQSKVFADRYLGGKCLIFRLCASDYHHYCYIDNGWQGANHYIPGKLHSVQQAALEKYPVFALNRRSWCVLETENFGQVIQTEIGALVVGGIRNGKSNDFFSKGEEKGYFELAGSTIVLMFEPGRISLLPEYECGTSDKEVRVMMGNYIGYVC